MKKLVLFPIAIGIAFIFFQFASNAQSLPYVVKNAGFFSHGIKLTVCNFDTAFTKLSVNHKLVADSIYSNTCGTWFLISLPSAVQGADTSAWICGALAALCDMVPDASSNYVLVVNSGNSGLFVRPAPVAGNVTINGAFAKIWDGQRFALTGNSQTVGGATWYEIYLTENCSQTTGWVSGNFVQVVIGTVGVNEAENSDFVQTYPNPSNGNFSFFLNQAYKKVSVIAYDHLAKRFMQKHKKIQQQCG